MSSLENKCEVSKDKHEDRGNMEYFRQAINSAEGRKGKSKPLLGEYIGIFPFFCYRACDSTRFSSLRLLELGNSPTALVAEGSYLVVTLKHRFRITSFLLSFRFLIFIFRPYFRVLIAWCVD